jgi:hypothetical protein
MVSSSDRDGLSSHAFSRILLANWQSASRPVTPQAAGSIPVG